MIRGTTAEINELFQLYRERTKYAERKVQECKQPERRNAWMIRLKERKAAHKTARQIVAVFSLRSLKTSRRKEMSEPLRYEFDLIRKDRSCIAVMVTPSGRKSQKTFSDQGIVGRGEHLARAWITEQVEGIRNVEADSDLQRAIEIIQHHKDNGYRMSEADAQREFRDGMLLAFKGQSEQPSMKDRVMYKAGFDFGKSIEGTMKAVMLEAMIATNVDVKSR